MTRLWDEALEAEPAREWWGICGDCRRVGKPVAHLVIREEIRLCLYRDVLEAALEDARRRLCRDVLRPMRGVEDEIERRVIDALRGERPSE